MVLREIYFYEYPDICRCYEENEFPYFLNMLSQRYGWVPRYDQVPEDIKHRCVNLIRVSQSFHITIYPEPFSTSGRYYRLLFLKFRCNCHEFTCLITIILRRNTTITQACNETFTIRRYKWLPGMSVTSLEIFTGAYWIHNPHVSKQSIIRRVSD